MGDVTPHQQRIVLLAQRAGEPPPADYEELMAWVGDRLVALDSLSDGERERVLAALDGVDLLHREGLGRLVDRVRLLGGRGFLERVVEDATVRALLDLYDLAPSNDEREVAAARRSPLVQIGQAPGPKAGGA